jgi:hypothetical protein
LLVVVLYFGTLFLLVRHPPFQNHPHSGRIVIYAGLLFAVGFGAALIWFWTSLLSFDQQKRADPDFAEDEEGNPVRVPSFEVPSSDNHDRNVRA